MNRRVETRLRKLEQRQPQPMGKWHRIIGNTETELAAKRAELMASLAWAAGDNIIERLIVVPPMRTA